MVSEEFKQNVASGNIIRVRSTLMDYLIADKTFAQFDNALAYAEKTMKIVEEYDGEPLDGNEADWNKDYLNLQKVHLMENFSRERIEHVKKVIKKVLPDRGRTEEKVIRPPEPDRSAPAPRINPQESRNTSATYPDAKKDVSMVSEEFKQNVAAGNIIRVRSTLMDYLIADKTFAQFDNALAYAEKTMKIVEEYDGEPLDGNEADWNKDYLNLQKVHLMENFSRERIEHVKKVIKKVLPDRVRTEEKVIRPSEPGRSAPAPQANPWQSRDIPPIGKNDKKKQKGPEQAGDSAGANGGSLILGGFGALLLGGIVVIATEKVVAGCVIMAAGAIIAGMGINSAMKK